MTTRTLDLTERELQVLALIAEGLSNHRIGDRLYLSADTIKTHCQRLYRKLGAVDRANAVAIAFRRGILTIPGDALGAETARLRDDLQMAEAVSAQLRRQLMSLRAVAAA